MYAGLSISITTYTSVMDCKNLFQQISEILQTEATFGDPGVHPPPMIGGFIRFVLVITSHMSNGHAHVCKNKYQTQCFGSVKSIYIYSICIVIKRIREADSRMEFGRICRTPWDSFPLVIYD